MHLTKIGKQLLKLMPWDGKYTEKQLNKMRKVITDFIKKNFPQTDPAVFLTILENGDKLKITVLEKKSRKNFSLTIDNPENYTIYKSFEEATWHWLYEITNLIKVGRKKLTDFIPNFLSFGQRGEIIPISSQSVIIQTKKFFAQLKGSEDKIFSQLRKIIAEDCKSLFPGMYSIYEHGEQSSFYNNSIIDGTNSKVMIFYFYDSDPENKKAMVITVDEFLKKIIEIELKRVYYS